jgi:hypothetical protein
MTAREHSISGALLKRIEEIASCLMGGGQKNLGPKKKPQPGGQRVEAWLELLNRGRSRVEIARPRTMEVFRWPTTSPTLGVPTR